jgi:hypothetical protein
MCGPVLSPLARSCALAFVVIGGGGCFVMLDHDVSDDDTVAIVARPADFADFTAWPHVAVGVAAAASPHDEPTRTVYLNAPPADDATTFPVGTIIVKTGAGGEATGEAGHGVHAMVKRGGGFNADGARGWEWFEISVDLTTEQGDDDPILVWRGANPPEGESYGCPAGQVCAEGGLTCNDCHAGSIGNDFVNSAALTLGDVDASLLGGAP